MSLPAILGALVGLFVGVADFLVLGQARHSVRTREGRRTFARIAFEAARVSQLILFPVVGWFAGPFLASAVGG